MNNPKVHLIIAIIAAILYIVSFFQEQNLMNGIGAVVFAVLGGILMLFSFYLMNLKSKQT